MNAGNVDVDMKHFNDVLEKEFKGKDVRLQFLGDRALIAIQGPKAASMLQPLLKEDLKKVPFMSIFATTLQGLNVETIICRCGYTGALLTD
jgi:aminomethyltransferase